MNKKGFTLIELLVVIAIIGLLASVVLASLDGARTKARDAKRVSDLQQMRIALELYFDDNGVYPIGRSFSVWNADTWVNPGNPPAINFYNALVGGGYMVQLPADPINDEGGSANYLGDNTPVDRGYIYDSTNGITFTLGTNLEQNGGSASNLGNYQITN